MPSLELNYIELRYDYYKNRWDEDAYKSLKKLTQLWDNGHEIIVCHPNKVFAKPPVNIIKTDFTKINWQSVVNSIDVDYRTGYKTFQADFNETLKYIVRKFRGEIMHSTRPDITMPRHLAVVERDKFGNMLVRGIIKATQTKFYFTTNPLYDLYMPKRSCEIKDRWQSNKHINLKEFIDANTVIDKTII